MTVAGELKALANPRRAFELQRFFKTAKGQYGEGDIFLGLTVPEVRKIAAKHKKLPFTEIEKLTTSKFHEFRLCGLVILTLQYKASKERNEQKKIFNFYLRQAKNGNVNNWDLVDVTAPIIGAYLVGEPDPYPLLEKLARATGPTWPDRSGPRRPQPGRRFHSATAPMGWALVLAPWTHLDGRLLRRHRQRPNRSPHWVQQQRRFRLRCR